MTLYYFYLRESVTSGRFHCMYYGGHTCIISALDSTTLNQYCTIYFLSFQARTVLNQERRFDNLVPQVPIPILMVQDQFNTVLNPDS